MKLTVSEDMVSRGVFEQVMWERDVAVGQLHELDYELGEKIRTTTTAGEGEVMYYPQVEGVTPTVVNTEALEQQPCEDAIDRSDMLDAIGHGTTYTSEELQRIIKGLPPVNPQPKVGHWIGVDQEPHEDWECDNCGHIEYANEDVPDEYHFCPNCGAKMQEVEE